MKVMLSAAAIASSVLLAGGVAQAQAVWTGPYFGGHMGYTSQPEDDDEQVLFDTDLNGSFSDTVRTVAGANAFSPGFCGGGTFNSTPAGAQGCYDDEDEFEIGLRAGYDQQVGPVVLGGVVELTGTRIDDSVTAFSTTPAFYTITRELEGLAAVRARVGLPLDRFMPYVTGGFAQGQVDRKFFSNNIVNTFTTRGDDRLNGYQLGAGVEAAVAPRLSLGLEYLYTSLDDDVRVRASGPAPATNPFILANPGGTDFARSEEEFDFHSVRVVANVRF